MFGDEPGGREAPLSLGADALSAARLTDEPLLVAASNPVVTDDGNLAIPGEPNGQQGERPQVLEC